MFGILVFLLIVGIALAVFPVDPTARRYILIAMGVILLLWVLVVLFGDYEIGGWYPHHRVIVH